MIIYQEERARELFDLLVDKYGAGSGSQYKNEERWSYDYKNIEQVMIDVEMNSSGFYYFIVQKYYWKR